MMDVSNRHVATQHIYQFFKFDHLPQRLKDISEPCCNLADVMIGSMADSPELTEGLRKLLEAKDCFVRNALILPLMLMLLLCAPVQAEEEEHKYKQKLYKMYHYCGFWPIAAVCFIVSAPTTVISTVNAKIDEKLANEAGEKD